MLYGYISVFVGGGGSGGGIKGANRV